MSLGAETATAEAQSEVAFSVIFCLILICGWVIACGNLSSGGGGGG